MSQDEEYLLKRFKQIKQHGWGKLEAQVQTISGEDISVSIIAGETKRFVLKKIIED